MERADIVIVVPKCLATGNAPRRRRGHQGLADTGSARVPPLAEQQVSRLEEANANLP
jgi:hypothetical protein